jgi:hypothetical protein
MSDSANTSAIKAGDDAWNNSSQVARTDTRGDNTNTGFADNCGGNDKVDDSASTWGSTTKKTDDAAGADNCGGETTKADNAADAWSSGDAKNDAGNGGDAAADGSNGGFVDNGRQDGGRACFNCGETGLVFYGQLLPSLD